MKNLLLLAAFLFTSGILTAADSAADVRKNLERMPRPWKAPDYTPASPAEENYTQRANTSRLFKIDWPVFEAALKHWAEKYPHARLSELGKTHEGDPIYRMTVTDFSVPEDQKFNIVITTNHSGAERSGLHAAMAALEYLLSPEAAKYRSRFTISVIPCANPYGFFRSETPLNSRKIDPYAAGRGSHWDIRALTPKKPEDTPELMAFIKLLDETTPELLLDWHGVGRLVPGEIMTQYVGSAGSNHVFKPWADDLVNAAATGARRGNTAVFQLERELQRLVSVREPREAFPQRFRDSGDYFYSDLYPYLKYHTLPIMFEIGYEEMAVNALTGLLDYGMNPPPELNNSLPVDNIITDWSGFMIQSYGSTPGEKRRSRVELWSKAPEFRTYSLYPSTTYHIGKVITFGKAGLEQLLEGRDNAYSFNLARSAIFENRTSDAAFDWEAIRQFIRLGPEVNLAYSMMELREPGTPSPIEHGITFAQDIQISPARQVEMLDVRVNGQPLRQDSRDGWELIKHPGGHRLLIHVPPEKSSKLGMFILTAGYTSDAELSWGWQPDPEIVKLAASIPAGELFAENFDRISGDKPDYFNGRSAWGYFRPGEVSIVPGRDGQSARLDSGALIGWVAAEKALAPDRGWKLDFDFQTGPDGGMICAFGARGKAPSFTLALENGNVRLIENRSGKTRVISTGITALPRGEWIHTELEHNAADNTLTLRFTLPDGGVADFSGTGGGIAEGISFIKFTPAAGSSGQPAFLLDNINMEGK